MLTGHKDPGTIASEIRMMRTQHAGAFVIVEGVADMRFWRPRKHEECELVNGENKNNVIGGVERLDAESFGGVLGAVDDDWDSLTAVDIGASNVVRTDAHDLECILCRSSALEKVLAEYGDESKIRRFETRAGVDVRRALLDRALLDRALLDRALVFGRLRWAAVRNGLDIDHSKISVWRFVDVKTWTVDGEGLVGAVVKEGSPCDEHVVRRCIAQLPAVDPWRVVRGHDLVSILTTGLRGILGDLPAGTVDKHLDAILRSGFSPGDLQATTLWTDIRAWEAGNHPFRVLDSPQ